MKAHILIRCNKTSKIGTTASGVVLKPESYLEYFGTEPLRDSSFACAKKLSCESEQFKIKLKKIWLSKIWNVYNERENSEWTSTYIMHHSWTVSVEPLLCVLILKHLFSCSETLKPAKYEWIIENELLLPTKNFAMPSDHTTKCRCKKGCAKNCWCRKAFDARNIATVWIARTYRFLEIIWIAL